MKLSFTIGKCDITIIDTDITPDCSELRDEDLSELTQPCLENKQKWDPVAQSAFEEQVHRALVNEGYYD